MRNWEKQEVRLRWPTLILGTALILYCLACGPLAMSLGPSEFLAKSLAPPIYPGSSAINHYRSGGPEVARGRYPLAGAAPRSRAA